MTDSTDAHFARIDALLDAGEAKPSVPAIPFAIEMIDHCLNDIHQAIRDAESTEMRGKALSRLDMILRATREIIAEYQATSAEAWKSVQALRAIKNDK